MRRREAAYIREVLDYEMNYKPGDGCPPIVVNLLLSIYMRLGVIRLVVSLIAGVLLAIAAK